jgi:hypothetical protein
VVGIVAAPEVRRGRVRERRRRVGCIVAVGVVGYVRCVLEAVKPV